MEQNNTCPRGCIGPEQGGSGCLAVTGDCAMDDLAAPAVDAAKLDELGKLKALAEAANGKGGLTLEAMRFRDEITPDAILRIAALVAQQAARIAELSEALEKVRGVANLSDGIAGWHMNGNVASWESVLPEIFTKEGT